MTVNFKARSLSQIDWSRSRQPAPVSAAMEQACASFGPAMDRVINCELVKQRARQMLAGDLPLRFCPRAAAIVARLDRRRNIVARAAA